MRGIPVGCPHRLCHLTLHMYAWPSAVVALVHCLRCARSPVATHMRSTCTSIKRIGPCAQAHTNRFSVNARSDSLDRCSHSVHAFSPSGLPLIHHRHPRTRHVFKKVGWVYLQVDQAYLPISEARLDWTHGDIPSSSSRPPCLPSRTQPSTEAASQDQHRGYLTRDPHLQTHSATGPPLPATMHTSPCRCR